MLGTPNKSARNLIFSLSVAAPFLCGFAHYVLASELPSDSFASLSPGQSKALPDREYTGIPLAGWMFSPSLSAGVVYDDNIFQTPTNRVARFGTRITPTITAVRDNGIHQSTLYGTADARLYSGVNEASSLTARAGFLHKYEAMRDLVFRFQGDFVRQTDPFNAAGGFNVNAAVANPFGTSPVSNPFPYNQFIGSGSVTKMFNVSFVSLRGSIAHITYDNSTGLTGSTAVAPPNGTIYVVTARAGYWVSPLFYAYLEPSLDWRRYDSAFRNSSGYRVVGGLATDTTGLYQGEIFAGYQAERLDQAAVAGSPITNTSVSGTVFGGRLIYLPTPYLTIRATLDEVLGVTQVTDASTPQGTSTNVATAMLQADYALSSVWMLSGRAGYTNVSYETGLPNSRHDHGWLGGLKYSFIFSQNFGVSLDYQYTKLDSNVVATGLTRSVVTLSGTYRY